MENLAVYEYGPFPGGSLISVPIDVNIIAELYSPYVLCSYLLHMYPLSSTIEQSNGTSIDVPENLFQLVRNGNILKQFIYRLTSLIKKKG
jgi:hypothetical protein